MANTPHLLRNGAVGFIDWLDIWCDCLLARSLGPVMVGDQPPAPLLLYPHYNSAADTAASTPTRKSKHAEPLYDS